MTAIAPNGVLISDFDANGIGALCLCMVQASYSGGTVEQGADLGGEFLFPCYVASGGIASRTTSLGTGTIWKCLGYLTDGAGPTGTLFMRVS